MTAADIENPSGWRHLLKYMSRIPVEVPAHHVAPDIAGFLRKILVVELLQIDVRGLRAYIDQPTVRAPHDLVAILYSYQLLIL